MNVRRVTGARGYTEYYEAVIENISGRKLTEEKSVYQTFHDPLTGLANRALFHDRLRMALRRATRQPNYSFAVLYLDLDWFKIVSDSLAIMPETTFCTIPPSAFFPACAMWIPLPVLAGTNSRC